MFGFFYLLNIDENYISLKNKKLSLHKF